MKLLPILLLLFTFSQNISAQPTLRWSISSKGTKESEKENNIYFDGKGNTYRFFKKYDVDTTFYVDKLDENGNLKYSQKISSLNYESSIVDVVFDESDCLYILSVNYYHANKNDRTAKLTKLYFKTGSDSYSFIIDSIKDIPFFKIYDNILYVIGFDKAQILYKYSLNGDLIYKKEIIINGLVSALNITNDRIYGFFYLNIPNNWGVSKVACFDLNGEKIWENTIADQSAYYVKSFTDTGGGMIYCYGLYYARTFVLRIDSNGIIRQNIEFKNSFNPNSCIGKKNNFYLTFYDENSLNKIINLYKVDLNGYKLITKIDSVSNISSLLGINIISQDDGSVIMAYNKISNDTLNSTTILSIDSNDTLKWKYNLELENNYYELNLKISLVNDNLYLVSNCAKSDFVLPDFSIISSFKIPSIENNIDKPIDDFSFVIYPNPNSIKTVFFKPELTKVDVFIYDNLGKLILSNLSFNGNSLELPINISVGLYSIIVRKEGKNYYKKLVIQ